MIKMTCSYENALTGYMYHQRFNDSSTTVRII